MINVQISLKAEHILHIDYKADQELQQIRYIDGRSYHVYIPEVDLKYIKKYFVCRKCRVTKCLMFINPYFAIVKPSLGGVTYDVISDCTLGKTNMAEFSIGDIADTDKGETDEQKEEILINEIKQKKEKFLNILGLSMSRRGCGYKPILPKNL